MIRISGLTCFFLVALRLVIGWHFLVEGVHKIQTHQLGRTATNTPWTGEGFFREGIGPAAPYFRDMLGDADQQALARLKPEGDQFPSALAADWQNYLDRFAAFYGLTDDQKAQASTLLADAKGKTLAWLKSGITEVKKTFPSGTVEEKETTPQRIAEYEAKLKEIGEILGTRLPAFNEDVEKAHLRTLKADAAKLRTDLLADLDKQFDALKKSLSGLLTPEQRTKGVLPDTPERTPMYYLDRVTMWTHAVLGACLLLGLFSRLASLGLAVFLLLVNLVAPALPYAPTPPGAIGYYLYVNLYVIEMVALLLLATVPTGRWFGLDALLYYLNPFRGRPAKPRPVAVPDRSPAAARIRR
jgi:uncharacterized membrane protein YphA (DoxX/SURF4 family)